MQRPTLKFFSVLFLVLTFASCGGGSGGDDDCGGFTGVDCDTGGGGGGGGTPTPSGTSIVVLTSNSQLPSDADTQIEGVTISAIVTDTNNNVVAGVPVTFKSVGSAGSSAPGGALIVTQATTDSSGVATAVLTTGGDTTVPRTITVTGTAGSIADTVPVNVVNPGGAPSNPTPAFLSLVGTATQLSSTADTPAEGINLTAFVTDANGVLLSGITVNFSLSPAGSGGLANIDATTDSSGAATATLTTGGNTTTPRTITVNASITGGPADSLVVDVINPIDTVTLTTSSPQLLSSADTAAEGITLTATVKDSNNTVLSGIDVAFFSSSGALQVTRGTTDASGTAIAILTTGGDPSNRNITVTATAAGPTTDSLLIPVTGTTLTLNGPSSLGLLQTGNYSATLKDAAGSPISGASLTVATAQLDVTPNSPLTTGPTGQINFTLTDVTGADDTVTVSGNGATAVQSITVVNTILTFVSPADGDDVALSATQPITVHLTLTGSDAPDGTIINFATTRGTINATGTVAGGAGNATVTFTAGTNPGSAIITASSNGVSATLQLDVISTIPSSIDVQAQPNVVNVNGQTTIQAVVRDASSNPVASRTVTFNVSIGPGGISPGTGVTNNQGVVTTTYTAPSQPTASNGVTITATVQGTGITDSTTLTVGGQALHISIGTGVTISDDGVTRYNLPYSVLVTDSNGNPPAAGTTVNLQVLSLRFYEGFYVPGTGSLWTPVSDPDNDGIPPFNPKVSCDSEDVNFNGVLNAGEDTHIAGPYQAPPAPALEPGNVASVPGTLPLDAGGTADFFVNYNKAFCSWVQVRLQATTAVAGTEASAVATFDLLCSAADLSTAHAPPGGSLSSPFGSDGDCTTAPQEPTACSDGINNDADAFTDFPTDPQCASAADNNESL